MAVKGLKSLEFGKGWEIHSGKACDTVFLPGGEHFLQVRTDRVSGFDRPSRSIIPGKGLVLNRLSVFWFNWLAEAIPWLKTHFITADADEIIALYPELAEFREQWEGRGMLVRRAERMIPLEVIVRGYLYGSGLKDYTRTGEICGIKLPDGLIKAQQFPTPLFTPSTKAPKGQHDQNISLEDALLQGLVLPLELTSVAATATLVYQLASQYAAKQGIILCDTKMEFGIDSIGNLMLCDEVFTPDSSRFWPADQYQPGQDQPSFDKQFVRDWAEELVAQGKWSKDEPFMPELPAEIIAGTQQRYAEAYRLLTGEEIVL